VKAIEQKEKEEKINIEMRNHTVLEKEKKVEGIRSQKGGRT